MADLSNVKVGDKLAVPCAQLGWSGPKLAHKILTVTKVTPTQVVSGAYRFGKHTGRRVGEFAIAEIATPEILEQHHKEVEAREQYLKARDITELLVSEARHNDPSSGDIETLIREFGHLLEAKK